MNELEVKVTQTPGAVAWNFEELKENLKAQLELYTGLVYTDETIATAKSDVAMLRKLAASVEERRKEIKNKCLEPYTLIEAQAKDLVQLINEPINAINKQVNEYEVRRKEAVKAEIKAYWDSKAIELPETLRSKAYSRIYDTRWENASTPKKAYKTGIDSGVTAILKDIETIKSFESEFESEMLTAYSANLQLSESITKMNQLLTMKKLVEERRQREEEARRIEAERAAQQAEAQRLEALKTEESASAVEATVVEIEEAPQEPQPTVQVAESQIIITETGAETVDPFAETLEQGVHLIITATPEQMHKIKGYITYVGATYKEA